MNWQLKISAVIILSLVFASCKSNPTNAVGDTEPTTSGYVRGNVVDSTSNSPLSNVQVIIYDIEANSTFSDTVFTDDSGRFEIGSIYEKNFYLSLKTIGYVCRNILISVSDTLELLKPIALERNHYPYVKLQIEEIPNKPENAKFYYQLSNSSYSSEWHTPYNSSQTEIRNIEGKIDSVIISLLRNDIKPDTLWYKFWQPGCSSSESFFDPNLIVMLSDESEKIIELSFVPYDFNIIFDENCIDSSETILRNTFFDL
jgi:hypothetical protein